MAERREKKREKYESLYQSFWKILAHIRKAHTQDLLRLLPTECQVRTADYSGKDSTPWYLQHHFCLSEEEVKQVVSLREETHLFVDAWERYWNFIVNKRRLLILLDRKTPAEYLFDDPDLQRRKKELDVRRAVQRYIYRDTEDLGPESYEDLRFWPAVLKMFGLPADHDPEDNDHFLAGKIEYHDLGDRIIEALINGEELDLSDEDEY